MRPPRRQPLLALSPLVLALLAACGGGGADSPAPYAHVVENPGANTGNTSTGTGGGQAGSNGSIENGSGLNLKGCRHYASTSAQSGNGTDPLLRRQWNIENTGAQYANTTAGIDLNVRPLWDAGLKGQGIRVAVVDDGVELVHEDLRANMASGSRNFLSADTSILPLPCTTNDDHGTLVAGVIAARDDNGVGLAGVAPRASLLGLNPIFTGQAVHFLSALSHQPDQTHVYNNSWGAQDDGQFHSPDASGAFASLIRNQLATARKGLGAIYTFAAGNGGHINDYSVYDGNVSLPGTLAICAINAQGTRSKFSEPGPNLTVCAPSGDSDASTSRPAIISTQLDNAYTERFSGTSAATPMASGVIALMLEANPTLTWRDVKQVLVRSARKNDPDNSGWTSFNGLNYNHEYGFGLIDADAAVKLARTWQSIGGSSSLKECSAGSKTVSQAIPEVQPLDAAQVETVFRHLDFNRPVAGGLASQISIPDNSNCAISHIEHVEVTLHAQPLTVTSNTVGYGDLQISLTSPGGQTSTLATPHDCVNEVLGVTLSDRSCHGLNGFTFGISRHMDEPAVSGDNRNWTLTVADRRTGKRVQLDRWELKLYGH